MGRTAKHIVIRALGSSGSSWLSLLLSSHPDRFYVGPPDRLWTLNKESADGACLVHGSTCKFLPRFVRKCSPRRTFLSQLERAAKGKSLVLFNPSPDFEEKELSILGDRMVNVVLLRDIRAVAFSLMRHNSERFPSAAELIRKALVHRVDALRPFLDDPNSLVIRYEDVVSSPLAELKVIGEYCGTIYDDNALRFWEFPHHMTAGNTGTIDLLRRMQGFEGYEYQRKSYYDEVLANMKEDPAKPRIDLSWTSELHEGDAKSLDAVFGEFYESFGYPRGSFSPYDESTLRKEILRDLPAFETANVYWNRKGSSL